MGTIARAKALHDEEANPLQFGLKPARRAKRKVVEPAPNEVQIDIDGPFHYQFYLKQRAILDKAGVTEGWKTKVRSSGSKGHLHITITLPEDPHPDSPYSRDFQNLITCDNRNGRALRVGLAAILCDDPHRAAFNWARVVKCNRYPIAFFERK